MITCEVCRYWGPSECRRWPTPWPKRLANDWCGEGKVLLDPRAVTFNKFAGRAREVEWQDRNRD